MLDSLLFDPAAWPVDNIGAACIAALLWGLGSALMSPCHLGIIPLLTGRAAGMGPLNEGHVQTAAGAMADVLLFAAGYYATIPLFGVLIASFGTALADAHHLWTVPAGAVLLWFGIGMLRGHNCSSGSHIMEHLKKWFGLGSGSGIFALGFGYGILSGGCSAGFLVPVMLISLSQGLAVCLGLAACFGIGHCIPMIVVGCSAPLAAKFMEHRHHHDNDNKEHEYGCRHEDPHRMEKLFRTVLGVIMICIGVLFMLHPVLEHH